jgi:(p)ppGpp synthase/HD superfamily hydrolase
MWYTTGEGPMSVSVGMAVKIAAEAHLGHLDKGGQAYILHPIRVMQKVFSDTEKCVAVMHDVVEDNEKYTLSGLSAMGFSPVVIGCLDNLTKRKGEDYEHYLARVACHPISIRVKIADIKDNMDISRLKGIEEKDILRIKRYHRALNYLRLA